MAHFYIDDSIHDQAGFAVGACVYSKRDLSHEISEILTNSGYDPTQSEFKSSANYTQEPQMSDVREGMRNLLSDTCKFGLVFIPRSERENLGFECLNGINQFIRENGIVNDISLYFDQSLFPSVNKATEAASKLNLQNCIFNFEQNSIGIQGLQLADLVAHTASIMLKAEMGLIKKMVKSGENSGYDPDSEMELEFEMWASLRNNFFHEKSKIAIDDPIIDMTAKVEPYGLYISQTCDEALTTHIRNRFESVYLGCIH